jgi:hypothetical protein
MPIVPSTRPKFAQWRWDRNLTLRRTAELLCEAAGFEVCTYEHVRRLCLPFGDERRSLPNIEVMAAIEKLTGAQVRRAHFDDPVRERAA